MLFIPDACGDSTRFEKLNAVFEALKLSQERSYYADIKYLDGAQTRQGFETVLKYVDPNGGLARYSRIDEDKIIVFQDRDTKQVVDFSLAFKPGSSVPSDPTGLIHALRRVAANRSTKEPLQGLRVALDPGHMGGKIWDKRTGKYVRVKDGRHVSEGEIALQVSLLLSRELKNLGAEVLLTRQTLTAVSTLDYETFDYTPYAQERLRASADQDWFDRLLESEPLGSELIEKAKTHREVRKLYRPLQRNPYFITRADLQARADIINAFNPHLTLIIHFDSPDSDEKPTKDKEGFTLTPLQTRVNTIRAYVPGNAFAEEFATREQRAGIIRHLFDGHRWVESNVLSSALVAAVSASTNIPIKKSSTDQGAIKVHDGVYARNLALNRLITKGATSYLEILFYNYEKEFNRLALRDKSDQIDGINIDYSSRLDDIVNGLKQGILDYVNANATKQPNPLL